jgi:hypothetical protein
MKPLSEFREDYEALSSIASNVNRQLGFAGIAIIWIFKIDQKNLATGQVLLPSDLYIAAVLIAASLLSDLLHYVIGSAIWAMFWRYKEKDPRISSDTEVEAHPWLTWPTWILFSWKIMFMIAAYSFLLKFLISHVGVGK